MPSGKSVGYVVWLFHHVLEVYTALVHAYWDSMMEAFPCAECRLHGQEYLAAHPGLISSTEFHDSVNQRLGKPRWKPDNRYRVPSAPKAALVALVRYLAHPWVYQTDQAAFASPTHISRWMEWLIKLQKAMSSSTHPLFKSFAQDRLAKLVENPAQKLERWSNHPDLYFQDLKLALQGIYETDVNLVYEKVAKHVAVQLLKEEDCNC